MIEKMYDKRLLTVPEWLSEKVIAGQEWRNMVLTSPWDWCRFIQTKCVLFFGVDPPTLFLTRQAKGRRVLLRFFQPTPVHVIRRFESAKWPFRGYTQVTIQFP